MTLNSSSPDDYVPFSRAPKVGPVWRRRTPLFTGDRACILFPPQPGCNGTLYSLMGFHNGETPAELGLRALRWMATA